MCPSAATPPPSPRRQGSPAEPRPRHRGAQLSEPCMPWLAAAAVGQVPDLGHLLACEVVFADQQLGEAAIGVPAPALAAARPFLFGVGHRVVIGLLLLWGQLSVVAGQSLLGEAGGNVVGISRNLRDVRVSFQARDLLCVAFEIHWCTAGTL